MAQLKVPVCFDVRRYLLEKYFDIVWGATPRDPQMDPPKNEFFIQLNLGCQSVMTSGDI